MIRTPRSRAVFVLGPLLLPVMLMFSGLGTAHAAPTEAARVLVAKGVVTGLDRDGRERGLKRGALLYSGDTVVTGNGQTQIRFLDRMLLTIYRNTRFAIDDYQHAGPSGEGAGDRAHFNLQHGAVHALTGAIGKANPKKFSMRTSFAILGVRGTDFMTRSRQKLLVSVLEGTVSLSNAAGDLLIGPGQNALVGGVGQAPVLTSQRLDLESMRGGGPVPKDDRGERDREGGDDRKGQGQGATGQAGGDAATMGSLPPPLGGGVGGDRSVLAPPPPGSGRPPPGRGPRPSGGLPPPPPPPP